MSGGPALPVDVEVGRHGSLVVVAQANGNVALVDVTGGGARVAYTVTNVDQLVRDLLTARETARNVEGVVATYLATEADREALP